MSLPIVSGEPSLYFLEALNELLRGSKMFSATAYRRVLCHPIYY